MNSTDGLFEELPMAPPPAEPTAKPVEIDYSKPIVAIIIPGEPVPKARPRGRIVYPRGGKAFIHFYQDGDTEKYEDKIRQVARRTIGDMNALDEKPLSIIVSVYLPIPSSWPDKKKCAALRGEIRPLSRPDSDNFLKIACDGLNGILWRDDSIVTDMSVIKRYAAEPRMEIEVYA
jgi:Holliday junction resolvase RusA-like endonuclease